MIMLNEEENKTVEAYKVKNKLKSKDMAIRKMINEFIVNIDVIKYVEQNNVITNNVEGVDNGIGNRLEKVE